MFASIIFAFCFLPFAFPSLIHAAFVYGPLNLSGNFQSQQILRHPEPDKWSIVQQRNVLRVRLEYDWVQGGRAFGRLELPFVEYAHLVLLYRGVYDSIYDFQPGPRQEAFPYKGRTARDGKLSDLSQGAAHALRFESVFREAYMDIELRDLPLSLRLGRQMVVWGESDNLRMLDRSNALDATWHGSGVGQESWDDIRIPYWMIKALYSIGDVGPLANTFIETYWVPGDWYPMKLGFLPGRPWSFPFPHPFAGSPMGGNFALLNDTVLGRQGDYARNIKENSQVGVRVGFTTPQELQVSLNYFYQRASHDDGMNTASLRGRNQTGPTSDIPLNNTLLMARGGLPAEAYYPYLHTVGISMSYADLDFTQGVWRMEMIYEFGVPFSDKRKPILILDPTCDPFSSTCAVVPSGLFGVKKSDAWQAFVGFDRPTWIRKLNRRSTFFITSQLFWQYIVSGSSRFQGGLASTDKVRKWEVVGTLAMGTVYLKGTLVPLAFIALDPINHYSTQVGWMVDYFITPNLILRLAQDYFFVPGFGGEVDESWGLGGLYRRWDETIIRLTYQF